MAYGWKFSGSFTVTRLDGLGTVDKPPQVLGLNAVAASPTQIDLTWTADDSGLTVGYRVERSTNGTDFTQIAELPGEAVASYSDTGRTASTLYYYRVKGYNAAESGAASATDSATTQAAGGSLTITSLTLTDAAGTEIGALTENLEIDPGDLGTATFNVVAVGSTGTQSINFVLTGPTALDRFENTAPYTMAADTEDWTPANGSYTLTVTPYTAPSLGGVAGTPLVRHLTVASLSAPAAPTIGTVTAVTSDSATVSWTDNSDNETGFEIDYATASNFAGFSTATAVANATSAVITGLTGETQYWFRVRATNSAGDSSNSGSATGTTLTPPAIGDRPSASNTGPTGVLTPLAGSNTITAANVASRASSGAGTVGSPWVIQNFSSGNLIIQVSNLTLRNFSISTGAAYGIRCTNGNTNLKFEDGEITGTASAGVHGANYTATRLYVHDTGIDAFKCSDNAIIEDCYITRIGTVAGSHADGVQSVGGSNCIIRRNCFDMWFDESANGGFQNSQCIIFQCDTSGQVINTLVEDNWIDGGGYSVQFHKKDNFAGDGPVGTIIRGNRFGRRYQYGLASIDGGQNYDTHDNVWDDSGLLVGTGPGDGGGWGLNNS